MNPIRDEWRSDDGSVRLILGDCLHLRDCLDVQGIVADPQYGIGYTHGRVTTGKWQSKHHGVKITNDDRPFDPSPWLSWPCILWGANHYAQSLPAGTWLVWDKRRGVEDVEFSMSDAEIAWMNQGNGVRMFRHLWFGLCRDSEIGEHHHPTQKPVALMEWCLGLLGVDSVADPYMGSGPTIVAAVRRGVRAVGIEIERKYWEIAVRRVRAELERFPLFEAVAKPRQLELLDAGDVSVSVDCPG